MSRNLQLERALAILRDLDRLGGVDLYELAERHGTTVRTIRRDLKALEAAGVPLVEESSEGAKKRWRVGYGSQLAKISGLLDLSHYLALKVAMGQGPAKLSSAVFASLEDLADKIENALGKGGREQLKAIESCFYSYEKFAWARSPPDVLWPFVRAIGEGRLCAVAYASPASKPRSHRVLPLKLFAHEGALYLFAHWPKHGHVGTLNLLRVRSVEVLEEKAEAPPDFDPAKWESAAFGIFEGGEQTRFRLRFESQVAPYIRERIWHPTQLIEERKGGSLELTFTCAAGYEVTSWIASWRDNVEVLEPESLRDGFAALGEQLAETYRRPVPRARRERTVGSTRAARTSACEGSNSD